MEHHGFKSVINVNTGKFSDSKCYQAKTSDLDKVITTMLMKMKKADKCNFIKSNANLIDEKQKPKRKPRAKKSKKSESKSRKELLEKII